MLISRCTLLWSAAAPRPNLSLLSSAGFPASPAPRLAPRAPAGATSIEDRWMEFSRATVDLRHGQHADGCSEKAAEQFRRHVSGKSL